MLHPRVLEALADTPVVAVLGPRAVGKSTLTREIASRDHPARLIDLDDSTLAQAANNDPVGFLAERPGPILIDEIQRAPDLLFAIKQSVFANPIPGAFLLTGSANILTAPRIKEALTGRAEYLQLWPLAQHELHTARRNFVDMIFAGDVPDVRGAPVGRSAFVEFVARGGFPVVRDRNEQRRNRFYKSYIESLIERDLRELGDARKLSEMPRLMRRLAAQSANVFSATATAQDLRLDKQTVQEYVQLLETVFLVRRIRAWRPGIGNREIQRPKLYFIDSGLLAFQLGVDERRIANDDQATGKLLETFIAMEVARLVDAADASVYQYHYRNRNDEVDIILESRSGGLVGIEVKAAATVTTKDYNTLVGLRNSRGKAFVAGIVFYTGEDTKALGDRIWAVPISGLWAS